MEASLLTLTGTELGQSQALLRILPWRHMVHNSKIRVGEGKVMEDSIQVMLQKEGEKGLNEGKENPTKDDNWIKS